MKLKSKFLSLAVTAAVMLMGVAKANAAAAIQLSVVYVGSTANPASNAARIAQSSGTGLVTSGTTTTSQIINSNLAHTDPSGNATVQGTANMKNYYALYALFTPNAATDALQGINVNVTLSSNLSFISSTNLTTAAAQKWIQFNPNDATANGDAQPTWSTVTNAASAASMSGVFVFQGTSDDAYQNLAGTPGPNSNGDTPTIGYTAGKGFLMGVFAVTTNGLALSTPGTISVSEVSGPNLTYYTAPGQTADQATSTAAGFSAINVSIAPGTAAPEPASLGVLALGGLALLARRRKSA